MMVASRLAPDMAIASIAHEDGFLLDAKPHQHHFCQQSALRLHDSIIHLPMATLCSRGTRIDRVAVVDALADGEALEDLDAHCRCWMGLFLSVLDSGRWFGSVSKRCSGVVVRSLV